MKTLIIYDVAGYVIHNIMGNYRKPIGIPYLEVDVPEGKRIALGAGVDVSVTPHQVILEDIPKSETELLKDQIQAQEQAILELAEIIIGGV